MNFRCLFKVFAVCLAFVLLTHSAQTQETRKTSRPRILLLMGMNKTTEEILYLLFDANCGKLQNAALKAGAKLETSNNFVKGYDGVLAFVGGRWGTISPDTSIGAVAMAEIYSFVDQGGRAVILLSPSSRILNETLSDLYSVVVDDELIEASSDTLLLEGETLCPLWTGLRLRASDDDHEVRIGSYLSGDLSAWKTTSMQSRATGKSRTVSAKRSIGQGQLWLIQSTSSSSWSDLCGSYFYDPNMINEDNEEAAIRLLKWIAKKK